MKINDSNLFGHQQFSFRWPYLIVNMGHTVKYSLFFSIRNSLHRKIPMSIHAIRRNFFPFCISIQRNIYLFRSQFSNQFSK